jgi:hypothetical protein
MTFSPLGLPIVGEAGEQTIEEVNHVHPGSNHGWPLREGTFLVAFADQVDGSPLGSDLSMRWMPSGLPDDPAVTFYFRDKYQNNLNQQTLARSGLNDDGFAYPVFQFTHEGNNTNGLINGLAVVAVGDYYEGFWSEELKDVLLFANFSTDQIFYGHLKAILEDEENAPVYELPFIDDSGDDVTLSSIIGSSRSNVRFGKDTFGNLYLASKTNKKLYRFQGTPKVSIKQSANLHKDAEKNTYFQFVVQRPPSDTSWSFALEITNDLDMPFVSMLSSQYQIIATNILERGLVEETYRISTPVDPESPTFYRVSFD